MQILHLCKYFVRDLTFRGFWYSRGPGTRNDYPTPLPKVIAPTPSCGQWPPRAAGPGETGPEGRLPPLLLQEPIPNSGGESASGQSPCRAPGGVSPSRRVAGWRRGGTRWPAASRAPSEAADRLAARQRAATCGAACRGRARSKEMWGRAGGPPIPHAGPFIKFAGTAGRDSLGFLMANSLGSVHLICMEIIS